MNNKMRCMRFKTKPCDTTFFGNDECNNRIVFFDNDYITEVPCKVYNDGGHFIAIPQKQGHAAIPTTYKPERSAMDDFFDVFYLEAVGSAERLSRSEKLSYIQSRIMDKFPEITNCADYVAKRLQRVENNILHRKKLCRRKAYLQQWNYWVTITYSDEKHDEQTFMRKLSKCLSNLHTRRGWNYIGVYERAPETGRRHFHALMYIPDGEMIGDIHEKTDYSRRLGHKQTIRENTFFAENFGRNDFEEVNQGEFKNGGLVEYMLKYIEKTGERIKYSRGLKSYIFKTVKTVDFSAPISDEYCVKFVLFDDVISIEHDVRKKRIYKQQRLRLYFGKPNYDVACIA